MKTRFILIIICSAVLVRCSNKPTEVSTTTQANLNAVEAIRQAIQDKNLDRLGNFIAADCVDHSGDRGDVKGLDSIKAQIGVWMAMADEKAEIVKQLADDDYVMSWQRNTGKYLTTGYGHRPGDTFDLQEMEIARFRNGKVVEHWTMMPPADVMKMMATTAAPVTMDNAIIREDSVRLKAKKVK